MATVLPSETPQYAFANEPDVNAQLRDEKLPVGSVIVAGKNFGCGSSREQAVSTLAGFGLTIVAEGIARMFLQNAINLGLKVVIASGVDASAGDELEFPDGRVVNRTTSRSFVIVPMPKSGQMILDAGGLIAYARRRLVETSAAAG